MSLNEGYGNPYPIGHPLWKLAERLVDASGRLALAQAGLRDPQRAGEQEWIVSKRRLILNAKRAVRRAYGRLQEARRGK